MYPYLSLFGGQVSVYGLCVTAGFTLGVLWCWSWRERLKVPSETPGDFWMLAYMLFFGWVIGARLAFYLVDWRLFVSRPWAIIGFWKTGWVFWGGLAGTLVAGWIDLLIYNRTHPRPRAFLPLADYGMSALPLGHWLGRVGCFLNGCCHGRPTEMPWGVRFTDPQAQIAPELLGVKVHPTQLYEAVGEVAIFLFLWRYVLPRIRGGKYTYGTAFYGYIILYAVLRFAGECFRGDDRGAILSDLLSPSQWGALAALAAASLLLYRQGIYERHPKTRSVYAS
ncbi:MAG: prolipoprotein diacylglyceryl transferase [Elusimicrobia bacterium]|nr:prolipoprotein diacylglyceryl transferase [Elusimicrobiota bacterium]